MEVKTHNLSNSASSYSASGASAAASGGRKSPAKTKKLKTKKDDSEFVFVDRESVMLLDDDVIRDFPKAKELMDTQEEGDKMPVKASTPETCLAAPSPRRGSFGSSHSSESFPMARAKSPEVLTLVGTLEAVMSALEEPKGE